MRSAALLVLALAACKTVARGDKFEEQIEAAYKSQGDTVDATCPTRIPLGRVETNRFRCELVIAASGQRVTIDVQLDSRARFTARPVHP